MCSREGVSCRGIMVVSGCSYGVRDSGSVTLHPPLGWVGTSHGFYSEGRALRDHRGLSRDGHFVSACLRHRCSALVHSRGEERESKFGCHGCSDPLPDQRTWPQSSRVKSEEEGHRGFCLHVRDICKDMNSGWKYLSLLSSSLEAAPAFDFRRIWSL